MHWSANLECQNEAVANMAEIAQENLAGWYDLLKTSWITLFTNMD